MLDHSVLEARVPVLAIVSEECGWPLQVDVLVPRGWGLPMWNTLIAHGCRFGGLRDLEHLRFEHGIDTVNLILPLSILL